MSTNNIAIIGGGLAGTCLAKLIFERGERFHWYIDDRKSASQISSGILNPVTGRRYALTWQYDILLDVAKEFYTEFLRPIRLEKHFSPFKEESSVDDVIRSKDKYLSKIDDNWIEVKNCYQLQTNEFINRIKQKLESTDQIFNEIFDYSLLKFSNNQWNYQGRNYDQVIFAEGIQVKNNPFFHYIDFRPNRGEALLLDIYTNKPEVVKKHGKFICPFGDKFWVGSSFDKVEFQAPLTTEKTKQDLNQALPNLIEGNDYKILDHLGALRSTTYDRRPIIGEHPQHKGLYVFNGFGAKGASLIPWCALQLLKKLVNGEKVNAEIDINRCKS
jgi:hypothetical protein